MNYKKMTKAELINELESLKSKLEVAGISGKSKDTTGRKQVDSELIARIREQEIVVYLGHKALRGGDISSLMNEVVKKVAETLDNEYCKILELLPDGKELLLKAGVGWKKALVGRATVPAGSLSQAGYTLQSRKPVIVEDLKTETRFSGALLLHEHNVVSGMSVIIKGQKGPWGVLCTHTTRHTPYSKDDINFLQAVANILTDVIVRKEAEETLKESEEKYHRLVESANDAIFVADVETGIIIDVNKRAEQMIGLSAEKIIGMHQKLLQPPEEAEYYKNFEDHINGGRAISNDIFVCNKNGKKIPVEISASITELKGRKIIQGIFRDITERKLTEEQNKTIIRTALDGFLILDTQGRILEANDAYCNLIGYNREKLFKMCISDVEALEKPEDTKEHIQQVIKTGGDRFESKHRCKDGRIIDIEVSTNYMNMKGGRLFSFIRDITERKLAEEKLQEQKKALEQKNIALSEVLGQLELEKKQIKDNVIANAENLLLPVIQKLRLKGESRKYVQLLRKNLQELTSSFGARLTEKKARLTSREIEICNMIKNGLTSKEIAGLSNISRATIERHRANIRGKLGIINKDINLSSFLRTL